GGGGGGAEVGEERVVVGVWKGVEVLGGGGGGGGGGVGAGLGAGGASAGAGRALGWCDPRGGGGGGLLGGLGGGMESGYKKQNTKKKGRQPNERCSRGG
ncbi:hypothetical protein ACSTLJ_00440, partial [Vibrio parahaemolyticus]